MLFTALRSLPVHVAPTMFIGASALISSLCIAICAAAPEFIWQGLLVALDHASWADLLSVLLISLNLAFFVEPAMERLRHLLDRRGRRQSPRDKPHNILFTASLSLAFAVTSVCLHDAMVAFVSGQGTENEPKNSALAAGLALITEWAIVPFAVTLAWQSVGCRWLAIPMGVIAGGSPCIAGWLFSWSVQTVITTTIPCWLILGFVYRGLLKEPEVREVARYAKTVALVAIIWLSIALLFDVVLKFLQLDQLKLYSTPNFFIDMRFYFGWTLGLVLAPASYRAGNATQTHSG